MWVERCVDTVGVCGSNPHAPTISIQQSQNPHTLRVCCWSKTIPTIHTLRALVNLVS